MSVFFCFTRLSLFVLGLVILCLVHFFFVVVWLSVPVQLKTCLRNDLAVGESHPTAPFEN